MTRKKFIMIPRSLVDNVALGNKRILAYMSIVFSDWDGENYEELVSYSLYSLHRRQSGVVDQYKDLVSFYVGHGYLEGDMVYIERREQFAKVYYDEFEKILQAREDSLSCGRKLNHANVLLLLAHIRLHIDHGKHHPKTYSNLLSRISESTGLSVRSITSALKVLEDLCIIHSEELPRYQDKERGWHANVRIFVDMVSYGRKKYDWKIETARGIEHVLSLIRKSKENQYLNEPYCTKKNISNR